jgi:hypothetical protein
MMLAWNRLSAIRLVVEGDHPGRAGSPSNLN